MTAITTNQTLNLLSVIGVLAYRPLEADERMAFLDAADDAQIAFSSEADLIDAFMTLAGVDDVLNGGSDAILVVVSGDQIELHGCTVDGEPAVAMIRLSGGY